MVAKLSKLSSVIFFISSSRKGRGMPRRIGRQPFISWSDTCLSPSEYSLYFWMPPSVMVNSVGSPTKAYLIFRIFATSAWIPPEQSRLISSKSQSLSAVNIAQMLSEPGIWSSFSVTPEPSCPSLTAFTPCSLPSR